jgi:hypothetical protein
MDVAWIWALWEATALLMKKA